MDMYDTSRDKLSSISREKIHVVCEWYTSGVGEGEAYDSMMQCVLILMLALAEFGTSE